MSSTPPRLCIVLLLAMLAPAVSAAQWLKLESRDVIIYSDGSKRDVVDFAVGYSAFRQVYREMFAPPQATPPAVVLLFHSLDDLQQHLPKPDHVDSQTISFNTNVDGRALVALALDGDRETALRQTIEFDTIFQLERSGLYMPIWLSQGAGEVLQNMRIKKNTCVVGAGYTGFEEQWQWAGSLSWPRFFEVTTSSKEYAGPKAEGLFHAKAWALMHLVLLDRKEGTKVFQGLVAKLQKMDAVEAVQSSLGVQVDKLDAEIWKHLKSSSTREIPFDSDGLRKTLVTAPAPEVEVHLQLSNLLSATGKADQAEIELARAQMLAPDSPGVIEARARSAFRERQEGEGVRRYRDAIAKGSVNPMAYLRSAEQRMREASGGSDRAGSGGGAAIEALGEIRKALTIDPSSAQAYVLLGRAMFLLPELKPEHIDELSVGVSRGPLGGSVRLYRALLCQRLERTEEYLADLRALRDDPLAAAGTRSLAAERLEKAEVAPVVAAVERLVKEEKYEDARATASQALMRSGSGPSSARFKGMLTWIDESEAFSALRAAVNARDWPKVTESGTKFLLEHPKSSVAPTVRRMVEQASRASRPRASTPAAD